MINKNEWTKDELLSYIAELEEALKPFAKMDRPYHKSEDLGEEACRRGICEDMTWILSKDFRVATDALKIGGIAYDHDNSEWKNLETP